MKDKKIAGVPQFNTIYISRKVDIKKGNRVYIYIYLQQSRNKERCRTL